MHRLQSWLRDRAENVAAAMLAAMFVTFLIQIVNRYLMTEPFGWTLELCLTLWIWTVFWCCAFTVRHRDHVAFDLVFLMAPRRVQRIFALASAGAIVIAFGAALLPTLDYIDFMKIKRSATMRIPMRTVFSIYGIFMVAVILTYAWRIVTILKTGDPDPGRGDPELRAE